MLRSKLAFTLTAMLVFVGCQHAPAVSRQPITMKYLNTEAGNISSESYSEPNKIENNLTSTEYGQITFNSSKELWQGGDLPYRVEFFHLGYIYNSPIPLYEFKGEYSQELRFSNDLFNFGNLTQSKIDQAKKLDQGYAGFKILCQLNNPGYFDELISFLGNSRFRALGRNNVYGAYAMTFGVLGDDGGIEIAKVYSFYLGKPSKGDTSVTIFSIAESESAVSAFCYNITQGDTCKIDVTQTVYPRKDISGIGIAPLASSFLYGQTTGKNFGYVYPEMHFSDGFCLSSDGNTIFEPLENYASSELSSFNVDNLSFFGLLQRDRNYENYQTPFMAQQKMPNVWISSSTLGKGKVKLVQLPSDSIDKLNIFAYFNPEEKLLKGQAYTFNYTINWSMSEPPNELAKVSNTRTGSRSDNTTIFAIKFTGDNIKDLPAVTDLTAKIDISGNARLISPASVMKDPYDNSWRVLMSLERIDKSKSETISINCTLMNGKTQISETWLYKWIL